MRGAAWGAWGGGPVFAGRLGALRCSPAVGGGFFLRRNFQAGPYRGQFARGVSPQRGLTVCTRAAGGTRNVTEHVWWFARPHGPCVVPLGVAHCVPLHTGVTTGLLDAQHRHEENPPVHGHGRCRLSPPRAVGTGPRPPGLRAAPTMPGRGWRRSPGGRAARCRVWAAGTRRGSRGEVVCDRALTAGDMSTDTGCECSQTKCRMGNQPT